MNEKGFKPLTFLIVAAEESGDRIGARLVQSIRNEYPDAVFYGVTGKKMQDEGVETWYSIADFSVMGFVDVIKRYIKLRRYIKNLIVMGKKLNPDYFIGMDAPDLNFRLHKAFKQEGIKTIQYVSPQLWAWRENRIHFVKKYIDLTLCLFPFEHEFYIKHGGRSNFVGHTLSGVIAKELANYKKIDSDRPVIAFMPGSRSLEIKHHLPIMIGIAKSISQKRSDISYKFILPNLDWHRKVASIIETYDVLFDYIIATDSQYDHLLNSNAAIVTSGTAVLESALLGVPAAVIYKVNLFNYLVFKMFGVTKRKFFSLPNIILQKELYREFIGIKINTEELEKYILQILEPDVGMSQDLKDGQEKLLGYLTPKSDSLIVKAILGS
jgi:lipid-A-disaccharide synthase